MVDNYWNAKGDQDPDKALYYKIHKKKIPQKPKAPVIPSSSSSSSSSSNNQSVLHVERKKVEREAQVQASSSKTTPDPKEKESASQQPRISDMFQRTKSKEQPKSRKGKEKETPIIAKSIETEEDDQRKTRGIIKKPNYTDYYDDSDLMDLDEQSEPDEVIDDPEYNNEYSDWQSIAREVSYIGQEFSGAPLYCVVAWNNGKKSLHPCSVVKNKCPKLVSCSFYHLIFIMLN
jgi:hypothetical protein